MLSLPCGRGVVNIKANLQTTLDVQQILSASASALCPEQFQKHRGLW